MNSHSATAASADPLALTHPKYRPDIDGLRAVAVLSVVGFHAFPGCVKGGFIGVDIFFVISGYLISSIIFSGLETGSFRIADFYKRRIRRIFPALIVVMIASLSFGWFALLADEYAQLGKHVAGGAAFLSNFIFYGESGYFDNAAGTKPMLHLWTLAIEEQFYILWPLMLAFVWKRKWNFLSLTAAIAILSFVANLYLVSRNPPAAFYWPISRFWELMIGGLLAYIALHKKKLLVARKNLQSLIGFALLGAGLALINKENTFPGSWALLPTAGTFFVISAGPEGWLNKYLLSNKLAVWVGLISYPLYLWHWPILSFARILESEPLYNWNLRIAVVLLSILLAAITYLSVEKPVRRARNAAIYLLFTMSCIASLGFAIFYNNGFSQRLGKDFATLKTNSKSEDSITFKACGNFHPADISLIMNCAEFGVNTTDNAAVYGDSHAIAAAPGIAEYLRDRSVGTYLYAKTACPIFLGVGVGPDRAERKKCSDLAEESLKAIVADRTIKKVFIFTRGPMYLTGRASADRALSYLIVPPKEFKDSLQKTIDYLSGAGKAVYYVTENPELNSTPYACARPFRLRKKNCDVYKVDVLLRQQEYLQILNELNRVKVIYAIDKFCPNGKCLTEIDGSYLYDDSDHLSFDGSRFQAKEVLGEFLLE